MLVLNFSHPLTPTQLQQIETMVGEPVAEVREFPAQLDNNQPFVAQIRALADAVGLSPAQWQTRPMLINPPAYNFAAVALTAELHGRMGYFPSIIRIRPVPDSLPPRFEVAEIIALQQVRDAARLKRQSHRGGDANVV